MKNGIKRLLVFLMVFIAVLATMITVYSDIDDIEGDKSQLESEIEKGEEKLELTEAEIAEKEAELYQIELELDALSAEINESNTRISALENEIIDAKIEVKEASYGIQTGINKLRGRILAIYMAGETSTVEIVLGAKDFDDFLDKVQLVKMISEHDTNIINEVKDQLAVVSDKKEALEAKKTELDEEKSLLDSRQNEYLTLAEKNEALLNELYQAKDDTERLINENIDKIAQLEDEILEYYAEQKRLEEERREQENASSGGSGNTDFYPTPSDGGYTWPCPGFYLLTSTYYDSEGRVSMHRALDIAGSGIMWSPVVAAQSGTVITSVGGCSHYSAFCSCGGGYGNYIVIDHGNGYSTLYGHLSSVSVSSGQSVAAGQTIGTVGSTGYSTGPHLHFEALYYGERYDPMSEF